MVNKMRASRSGLARRKRYDIGGTISNGRPISSRDISTSSVNGVGNAAISTVLGAATGVLGAAGIGAALGTTLGPLGTITGAGLGAVVGLAKGLFGNKARKQAKAAAQEQERLRQQSIMQDKFNSDIINLRQATSPSTDNGEQYYLANGGLIPNSSNTQVAYGATHNQQNDLLGGTGVPIGNAEVEGGGDYNGRMYPGEVIKNDVMGDMVFSDKLKVGDSNKTFADVAKKLYDKKGKLESRAAMLQDTINQSINDYDSLPLNKLESGTAQRNIEKDAYRLNEVTGRIAELDQLGDSLFQYQEENAEAQGLRNSEEGMFKHGGRIMMANGGRRKMPFGGLSKGLKLSHPEGWGTLAPITPPTGLDQGSTRPIYSPKGFSTSNSNGFLSNTGLISFGLNALNTLSTANAINQEANLPVAQRNRLIAPRYSTEYNISGQLSDIDGQVRSAQTYIDSNVSNAQVRRNAYARLGIESSRLKGSIRGERNRYQNDRYDMNVNAQYQNQAANNEIDYQNASAGIGRQQDIIRARAANNRQFYQSTANLVRDLNDANLERYGINMTNLTLASDADRQRLQSAIDNTYNNRGNSIVRRIFNRRR